MSAVPRTVAGLFVSVLAACGEAGPATAPLGSLEQSLLPGANGCTHVRRPTGGWVYSRGSMGWLEHIWSRFKGTAPLPVREASPPLLQRPRAPASSFVSQPGDVPGLVVALLERNGNALVETRKDKTALGEPCTEYLFRDPLVLTAEQHRAVKKHLTRCNPDRPMDGFSQLTNSRHGDRFAWIDSEDVQHRRRAEAEEEQRRRSRREEEQSLRERLEAARSAGKIPPRPPPLRVPSSAADDLPSSPDCDALDDLLESLGVCFLVNRVQPDDVAFRLLDRDVLLPRALFVKLHDAAPSDLPTGREISIASLSRPWDRYAVANDDEYAEHVLAQLEWALDSER